MKVVDYEAIMIELSALRKEVEHLRSMVGPASQPQKPKSTFYDEGRYRRAILALSRGNKQLLDEYLKEGGILPS